VPGWIPAVACCWAAPDDATPTPASFSTSPCALLEKAVPVTWPVTPLLIRMPWRADPDTAPPENWKTARSSAGDAVFGGVLDGYLLRGDTALSRAATPVRVPSTWQWVSVSRARLEASKPLPMLLRAVQVHCGHVEHARASTATRRDPVMLTEVSAAAPDVSSSRAIRA